MDIRKVRHTLSLKLKSIPAPVWFLAVVLAVMTGTGFVLQSGQAEDAVRRVIRLNMDDVESMIDDYGRATMTIRLESDAQAIAKAHALSYMIELKPSIVGDSKELERISRVLDVDEAHISDKNGLLVGSSLPDYVGYDMASKPQSKAFMLAIYYRDFELAQKPQPKGIDGTLFQYAGVARIDRPGIVQVGFKPERLEKVMETADISKVAKDWRIGANGQVMIADFDGKILSTIDGRHLGESLAEYGFPEKVFNGAAGEFRASVQGEASLFVYRFAGKNLIIASVPDHEIYGDRNGNLLAMLLISILSLGGGSVATSRSHAAQKQETE
ncbi:cache domain-containing protein [Chlorobium sp. N1]|uniref:cache domain-containing protein n=1 Tax=Chlorobium sp. N1 TaxID=2491138 RepID=UPI001F615082|nr:cache domain-containing protein [Chlorobium sp. N1]